MKITHDVIGLAPVADAFTGTVYSDIVSMRDHGYAEFIILKGVGATGTATLTVEACDDVSGSNVEAVEFFYQAILSGDTPGAITQATTAGFATTAGSNQMYRLFVNTSELSGTGYGFVRLKSVEVVDSPVLGGILIRMHDSKDGRDVPSTVLT